MKKIDENYFINNEKNKGTIDSLITEDEQILWRGKPKKNCFILSSFLKMMPIAIIWLIFDASFITILITTIDNLPKMAIIFLSIFFVFHLIPVWIWISNMITANKKYKVEEYAFTNYRVIIKSGLISSNIQSIYYEQLNAVDLKTGIIEKMFKVGDIYLSSNETSNILQDIEDPHFISRKLEEISRTSKKDIYFPNELREKIDENK